MGNGEVIVSGLLNERHLEEKAVEELSLERLYGHSFIQQILFEYQYLPGAHHKKSRNI